MVLQNTYIKRGLQIIIIIILLMFTWYVGKDWLRPRIIKGLGGYTKSEVTRKVDTLQSYYDTIYFKYKNMVTELEISKRKEVKDFTYTPTNVVTKPSTSVNNKGNITTTQPTPITPSITLPLAYVHENAINDSLVEGKITTYINPSDCELVRQTFDYKPKFPIIVKEYIPIRETITETLSDKPKAYFGIGVLGTTNKDIGGQLIYQTPSKWQFGGGYLKYDNSILLPNKQDAGTITISITKLF